MDSDQFDTLVSRLSTSLTRRKSLGLLGLGGIAGVGLAEEGKARKKKKGKGKGKGKGKKKPTTPPPGLVERLDATCPHLESFGVGTMDPIAQTFLARQSGLLTKVQVTVLRAQGGVDVTFEIRNVDGDGEPATVRASCVARDLPNVVLGTDSPLPLSCTFPSPTTVVKGGRYALAVTTSPVDVTLAANTASGSGCPDGQFFSDADWVPEPTYDLAFETYVTS